MSDHSPSDTSKNVQLDHRLEDAKIKTVEVFA